MNAFLKFKYCFLLLIFFTNFSFAKNKKTTQEIAEVLKKQQQAWNSGSIEGFMNGYWRNDSLQFITVRGVTSGWDKMLNRYQNKYPNKDSMGILQMNILKIEKINTSNYVVIGKWQLKRTKDSPMGYFTLLFRKIKGSWLIVKDHTS